MSDYDVIDTSAGTYTVEWLIDEGPEQPYDYGWTLYMPETRIDVTDDTEKNAVPPWVRSYFDTGDDRISGRAIIRYLALLGLRASLVNDWHPVDPADDFDGIAIAPHDIPDEHLTAAYEAFMGQWRAWAEGDVVGYEVTSPDGRHVDSCWGFYGFDANRDYILSEARDSAEYDAAERVEKSNLVGAGFVGII